MIGHQSQINCYIAQIICSSCKDPDPEIEAEIRNLLSQRYFVPVLRVVDFSAPAVVGKPWSPDVSPGRSESGPGSPIQVVSCLKYYYKEVK